MTSENSEEAKESLSLLKLSENPEVIALAVQFVSQYREYKAMILLAYYDGISAKFSNGNNSSKR